MMAPGRRQMVRNQPFSRPLNALSEPFGELIFTHFSSGQGEHGACWILVPEGEDDSIDPKEQSRCDPGRSFVAINKRVIARNARGVCCGEGRRIGLPVRREILRAGHCGLEPTQIAQPRRSAMLR